MLNNDARVSNYIFYLYLVFACSYFLHIPNRLHTIAIIRPDLLLALLICFSLLTESSKLSGRLSNSCGRIILILLIYILVSLPFVEWPGSVLRDNLFNFLKAVVFFYFTVLIIDEEKRIKYFIMIFIFCQLIRVLEPLIMHEVYGYWGSHTYIETQEFTNRLAGAPSDVVNPNGLAFIITTLFPFLHYLYGTGRWKSKIFYYLLIPILLYALVLTLSRSGFIALLVVVWNIFIKSRKKLIIIVLLLSGAVMLWANMNDIQKQRYLSITGSEDVLGATTFHSRLSGYTKSYELIIRNPIFGYGLGTSLEAIYHIRGTAYVSHILYEEVWVELGTIGLIVFTLYITRIYKTLREARRIIEDISAIQSTQILGTDHKRSIDFNSNLYIAIQNCFWMYIVFSLAQYGLSEYHWYLIGGFSVVLYRSISQKSKIIQKQLSQEKQHAL